MDRITSRMGGPPSSSDVSRWVFLKKRLMIPLIPGPFSGSTVEIRDTALLSFLGMHLDRVSRVRGSGLFGPGK